MTIESPAAADLILDFLTTFRGGQMSVQTLRLAGSVMGLTEAVIRVTLTRLCQQKKVAKLQRGTYGLHPAYAPLQRDVATWQNRFERVTEWNGGWVAVHEPREGVQPRTATRRHRRALALRGFRSWTWGLHLRPDNLRGGTGAMREQLTELGLLSTANVFGITECSDNQMKSIRPLWDTAALRHEYADLHLRIEASEANFGKIDAASAARESLLLGRHVISRIVRDPLLPAEMMIGNERDQLVAAMHRYQDRSLAVWNDILFQSDPV